MQDGLLEPAHLGHVRIYMEWVCVAIQTVQNRLIRRGGFFTREVSGTLGHASWHLAFECTFVAESAKASDEEGSLADSRELLGILFSQLCFHNEERAFAFVLDVSNAFLNDISFVFGKWLMEKHILLTMKQHHGIEIRHTRHSETRIGHLSNRHGVGRERSEVRIELIGISEMFPVHRVAREADAK
jgi:hypothetical protein